MTIDIDTPPQNPIQDFEMFLNLYEVEPNYPKYKHLISEAYSRNERYITIDLGDLLNYNPSFYNYLKNSPDQAIEEMIKAFKNCMRLDAGGQFNPDKHYAIYFHSKGNLLLKEIRQLSNNDLYHLVQIDAEIMGITEKYLFFTNIAYECPMCGNIMTVSQISEKVIEPNDCSNPNCQNKKGFVMRQEDSESISIRTAFIKDNTQHLMISIQYHEDQHYEPGDIVNVFGVIRGHQVESRSRASKNQFRIFLQVNNMNVVGKNQNSQALTNDSRVYLAEKGIFLDKVTQEEALTECLFSWDEFKVQHRYMIDQGPSKESRYIGYIRLKNSQTPISFYNANVKDIKEVLQKECAVSGKNINFCTMPLQNYLTSFPDESEKITLIMGFTQEGWKLPFNSICLIQDHNGNEIYRNIKEVFERPFDKQKAIENFRKIYLTTGIAHKDQLFQWSIASPFLYVFREIGGIMPGFAAQGPPQTGKSRFFEMVMLRWFGHVKEIVNGDNIGSASRLTGLIASSTLPIFIDDCSNSHPWIVDVIKSYLTLGSNVIKKGAGIGGQFATVNKPLTAPCSLSCNDTNDWFSDDAFLERVYLELIDACDQKEGWFEARDAIVVGSILRVLYEYTKDWKKADLQRYVKEIEIPENVKGDSRKKYIYLAFAFAARLMKDIFGIETKLDRIITVLNRTRQTNMESLMGLIEYQIEHGLLVEKIEEKQIFDDMGNFVRKTKVTKYYFNPETWVRHPLYKCEFDDDLGIRRSGYIWNINNIRDLQNQFEGNNTKKWTLNAFYVKIQKQFKISKSGRFYSNTITEANDLEDKLVRGVAIATSEFEE